MPMIVPLELLTLFVSCQCSSSAIPTPGNVFSALQTSFRLHKPSLDLEKRRKLYSYVDWTQPKYYETTKTLQVGHKIVYFTRGSDGVLIAVFDTSVQKWVSSKEFNWLSDAGGWNKEKHYEAICIAEMGLKMYVYGRGVRKSVMAVYDLDTAILTTFPLYPYLRDADGFDIPAHYRTIRMAAVGSLLYVSARNPSGIHLASFDPSTGLWTILPTFTQFIMTDQFWATFGYYTTLRMVAQSDSLWFFVRGPLGINLFYFDTLSTTWLLPLITRTDYLDLYHWYVAKHSETFRLVATANGVYVTARSCCNIRTYFYDIGTGTLHQSPLLVYYTDAKGWNRAEYYQTLRFLTCGGDSVIILGRGPATISGFRLATPTSGAWTTATSQPSFTDAEGWNLIYKYRTLNAVCVNDQVYVVGRNLDKLEIVKYSIGSDSWSSGETITSQTCKSSCKVCFDTAASDCTYCYPHAHLGLASPAACLCDQDFFRSPGATDCSLCHPTCHDCVGISSEDCTFCPSNAQLAFPPVSTCICNANFYLSSAYSCLPCDYHCLFCSEAGPDHCTACRDNALLQNNFCVCAQTYYMNEVGSCANCHTSCKTCLNAVSCLSCFQGAHISILTCECSPGYFPQPDAYSCAACSFLCVVCKSADKCEKCGLHAEVINKLCYCDQTYYATSGVLDCLSCPQGCFSCSAETCLKCLPNWYVYEGKCTQICPTGMVVREERCTEASPEPALLVHPNNTLALSFSKPLTKILETVDIDISISSQKTTYTPTWTISHLVNFSSYLINLHFPESIPSPNSTALLTFPSPASLHDSNGLSLTQLSLSAALYPYPVLPSPSDPAPLAPAAAASQGAVAGALASSFFGGSPAGIFSLLNQLQLISYIPFVNVTLPEDLVNTLKGLELDSLLTTPFGYIYSEKQAKAAPTFTQSSYSSTLFLINANSLVISCSTVILTYLVCSLLSHIPHFQVVRTYFNEVKSDYYWSVPLRLWLQLYLDIGVAAFLQFHDFSWSQYGGATNGAAAGVSLCAFLLTPVAVSLLLVVRAEKALQRTDAAFNKRWGTLFLEFRPMHSFPGIAFYPYFLVRRCLFAVFLVYLHSYPCFQLLFLVTSSIAVRAKQALIHLLLYAPYQGRIAQWTAVLGEAVTLASFGLAAVFLGVEAKSSAGEVLGLVLKGCIWVGIGGNAALSVAGMVGTWVKLVQRFKIVVECNAIKVAKL